MKKESGDEWERVNEGGREREHETKWEAERNIP